MSTQKLRFQYVFDKKELVSATEAQEKFNKEQGISQKEIDETTKKYNKQGKELNSLDGTMKKVGATILATFAADRIISFAKGVVDVTARFQKMEAVLKNTLGSGSRAQKALMEIQRFASETPFSVSQLTDSFIKLANQGFVPTIAQMKKLGDIAASTGKDFDQLAEAIIDAQVGEFERLKEFGIRSQKEGDKVIFTFKGVREEVDFTSESIQDYILSLGDIQGVSGATAAISDTVAGKISNLGDNFEALQKKIGDDSEGLIASLLDLSNAFLKTLASSEFEEDIAAGFAGVDLKPFRDEVQGLVDDLAGLSAQERLSAINDLLDFYNIKLEENKNIGALKLATEVQINQLLREQVFAQADIDEFNQKELSDKQKELDLEKMKSAEREKQRQLDLEDESRRATKDAESLASEFEKEQEEFESVRDEAFESDVDALLEKLEAEEELKFAQRQRDLEEEIRINDLKKESAQALAEFKIQQEERLFNSLIQIAGRGSQLGKTVALAQIAYDTGEAIAALTAASEANPANAVTFGGAGIAQYIAGIARITTNIASAKSVLASAPKFEKGGRIGGNLHSNGGTHIEAERDEFVMSRKATSKYGFDLMSQINSLQLDPDILNGASGGSVVIVDNSKLAEEFRKRPENHISIDEEGFTRRQKRQSSMMISKERRYST